MKTVVLIALGALVLAGCSTSAGAQGFPLLLPIDSQERLAACGEFYEDSGSGFAECWRGERPTRSEWCAAGVEYLSDPWAEEWDKAYIFETMRNKGCMNL